MLDSLQQSSQQSRNPIQALSSADGADDVRSVYLHKNSPAVAEPLRKTTLSSKPQTFRSPLKHEKKTCCLRDPALQWRMCWSAMLTFFLTMLSQQFFLGLLSHGSLPPSRQRLRTGNHHRQSSCQALNGTVNWTFLLSFCLNSHTAPVRGPVVTDYCTAWLTGGQWSHD